MNRDPGRLVTLGQVVGVYGVRGEVKVVSHTRPRGNIFSYREWWLYHDSRWQQHDLENGYARGKGLVAKLAGCDDRDAARSLTGADIAVSRDSLPALPVGEYYWCDLLGLEVRRRDGVLLGRVTGLEETGANDVLVVEDADGQEQLIPYVADRYVLAVDLEAGTITVDWPSGPVED